MRRIKKAKIEFISLVPAGANKMPVLYKADGMVEFDTLVKASEDAGELLAVVYAPEHRDSQGDIASAEVIKDMAYDAARRGVEIDLRHDGKPVGRERAYVAESFLVAKGDERFAGWKDRDDSEVDLTGAWATVIKIEDPELRRLYREGVWGGVSMAGRAEVVATTKSDDEAPSWFTKALQALGLGRDSNEDDIDMKKEELQEILKEQFVELAKALKPEAPATEDTVEKDDETEDPIEARLAKIEAALAKLAPEDSDEGSTEDEVEKDDDEDPHATEIAELKARLAKLQKGSNRDLTDEQEELDVVGLSKEDAAAFKRGSAMAAFINGSRG